MNTCSFRYTNSFLEAKIISDYLTKVKGKKTAIFCEVNEKDYIVWSTMKVDEKADYEI
jgi:hypothetical protein